MINKLIDNLHPFPDKTLTCFERPIYAYIRWQGHDPEYLGLSTWSFTSNYVRNYKGIHGLTPMEWIINGAFEIYGIRMDIKCIHDQDDALMQIEEELINRRPSMVYVDSFYCPWYPSYKKSHINHYVLVVGRNRGGDLVCIDKPSEDSSVKILPLVDYFEGRRTGEIIVFSPNLNEMDICKAARVYLKKQINIMESSGVFENIRQYSIDIQYHLNIQEELENAHDYRVAAIYTWLKGIATSRNKFAHALVKCGFASSDNTIYELNEISIEWSNILLQLMLATDRDVDFNLVSSILLTIADREENCFNSIKQSIARDVYGMY